MQECRTRNMAQAEIEARRNQGELEEIYHHLHLHQYHLAIQDDPEPDPCSDLDPGQGDQEPIWHKQPGIQGSK
jgi:hypothetical protein